MKNTKLEKEAEQLYYAKRKTHLYPIGETWETTTEAERNLCREKVKSNH